MKFYVVYRLDDNKMLHYISRDDELVLPGGEPTYWRIWYADSDMPNDNPQAPVPHEIPDGDTASYYVADVFDDPRVYKRALKGLTEVSDMHRAYVDKCVHRWRTGNYPPLSVNSLDIRGMSGGLWPEPHWNEQVQPRLKAGARSWSYRL